MTKLRNFKLYFEHVHMTLPVYLQHLPLILITTVHTFITRIHDNIQTNMAKHDFAKR